MKRNLILVAIASAPVFLMLAGSVWLSGQQPPLLDQADVQAVVDFCMGPTGVKVLQPAEPGTDRAVFCAGLPFVALYAAADVRNTQALNQVIENQIQIMADIAALQAQSSATLQPQIDAINAKLLNVANALQ